MAKRRLPEGHGRPCPYCGKAMLANKRPFFKPLHPRYPTRDHIRPRAKGGGPVIIVCAECNSRKGDMPPEDWLQRIAAINPEQAVVAAIAMGMACGIPMRSGATEGGEQ